MSSFDRDVELGELLERGLAGKISHLLDDTLGKRWRITDTGGKRLLGNEIPSSDSLEEAALRLDFEVAGKLAAAGTTREQVEHCARWMELVLAGAWRYRMASDLHLEAVHADYEALQRKHAALQESETRYRELAFELEKKVAEQVETITRAHRQLYQTEKMASVGSLAAGMAHEINNPIGFIRSNAATSLDYVNKMRLVLHAYRNGKQSEADVAWKQTDIDFILEDFPVLLNESISGADRVARIVTNLKRYANVDYALSAQVDPNEMVKAVAAIIADQLPERIRLGIDLQPLPFIVCDRGRINQMLLSIMQNAAQAIEQEGEIRVSTSVDAGEIRIAIHDDGKGIEPEILSRIFDPFFTTRDVGKGTGLGLTVGRDIAAAHGGCIEVESAPGKGSLFTVCLPVDRNDKEGGHS